MRQALVEIPSSGLENKYHSDVVEFDKEGKPYHGLLFQLRQENNLTLQGVAERIGYKYELIWQIESLRIFPSLQVQQLIAELFNIPIDTLFPQWLKVYIGKKPIPDKGNDQDEKAAQAAIYDALRSANAGGDLLTDPEQAQEDQEIELILTTIFQSSLLCQRDKEILLARFLDDESYESIAARENLTKPRVGQLEHNALKRVRSRFFGSHPEYASLKSSPRKRNSDKSEANRASALQRLKTLVGDDSH